MLKRINSETMPRKHTSYAWAIWIGLPYVAMHSWCKAKIAVQDVKSRASTVLVSYLHPTTILFSSNTLRQRCFPFYLSFKGFGCKSVVV